ncbi:MAG: hypothetical protein AB1744_00920 [Candidatus Zixiibacteriota bacterium]
MAGHGKGVLRIAIEDFLETFDFGKILHKWWIDVTEKIEEEAINVYHDMARKTGLAEYLPKGLVPEPGTPGTLRAPVQLLPILIAIVMMVIGLVVGALEPIRRIASYKVDAAVKSGRPTPLEAYTMGFREFLGADVIKDMLRDQGMSDALMAGFQELARPLLSAYEYQILWRRKILSDVEFEGALSRLGMSPDTIAGVKALGEVIPGVQDLISMGVREAFTPAVVERFQYDQDFPTLILEHTRKQGLSDEWTHRYWWAHWQLPSPTLGYEMLHRLRPGRVDNPFTTDDLDLLLKVGDFAPYFRDKMMAVSYTPVTRVDIRRIYKLGVINYDEMIERYMDIGYTREDATLLADFTRKYESSTGVDKNEEYQNLTRSVYQRMYKKGILTEEQFRSKLRAIKLESEEIELLVKLTKLEIQEDLTPDYRKQYISDMVNDIEKAYASRMITEANARAKLGEIGLTDTTIDYIVQKEGYQADLIDLNEHLKLLVDARIAGTIDRNEFLAQLGRLNLSGAQQDKIIQAIELQMQYRARRLTEAQYRAAARAGIITLDEYKLALVGLGISDKDIEILVKLYFPAPV